MKQDENNLLGMLGLKQAPMGMERLFSGEPQDYVMRPTDQIEPVNNPIAKNTNLNDFVDKADPIELQRQENKKMFNASERQQELLGQLQEMRDRKSNESRVDYTPLAATIDALTGSNFAKSIKRPKSREEEIIQEVGTLNSLKGGSEAESALDKLAIEMRKSQLEGQKLKNETARKAFDNPKSKPLSGEMAKRVANASDAISDIDVMMDILEGGGISDRFNLVGDNRFTAARERASDAIGRLKSGAAINNDEKASFVKMLSVIQDSPEQAADKLATIRSQMKRQIDMLRSGDIPEIRDRASTPGSNRYSEKSFDEIEAMYKKKKGIN